MEHSKKLILVPEERLNSFIIQHLSELDKKMQDILRRKDLSESEKATLYLQVLQKYVSFKTPENNKEKADENGQESEETPVKVSDTHHGKKDVEIKTEDGIEGKILEMAPVRMKAKAKDIYDFLKNQQTVLSWTPQGEIVSKGEVIVGSHIAHLINDILRNRKKVPVGQVVFKSALKEMDFPSHYIVKRNLFTENIIFKKRMYAKRHQWISYK